MDKEQFTQAVLEAEQTLYRIAKTMLVQDSDCEDAVQQAIVTAYSKLDTLKQPTFLKTWMVRILINECHRKHRSQKPTISYEDYFETAPSADQSYATLYHAIVQLKEKIKLPIVLHYIEGYSVEEIKGILSIPAGTVKSRLFKGRTLLREYLESEESS